MSRYLARCFSILGFVFLVDTPRLSAGDVDLVNIKTVDPTIMVELRYATTRNITHRVLYPSGMPALVRPKVAAQLAIAQQLLRPSGYRLKIWDAYRPKDAHNQLWILQPQNDYVADPAAGGSLHTWGVAVDATLVDRDGRDVAMPTDFDDFTPAAWLRYAGPNQTIRHNLRMLQAAMAKAGFYGMRTEWWHFVTKDWKSYEAIPGITVVPTPPPKRGKTVSNDGAVTRSLPPPTADNRAIRPLP